MRKTLLATSIALACVLVAHAATPIADSPYDRAVEHLQQATTPQLKQAAFAELDQALANGDARAGMRLGQLAMLDVPFAGDLAFERALRYFAKAVELDAPGARDAYALALTRRGYYAGKDTEIGHGYLVQAFPLLEQLEGDADPDVLWNLGFLESTGLGGKQDLLAGARHTEQAADLGNGPAAFWTANRYANAIPTETEAEIRYLRIAAKAGVRGAAMRLADYADRGIIKPDPSDDVAVAAPPSTIGVGMGAVTTATDTVQALVAVTPEAAAGAAPVTSTVNNLTASTAKVSSPEIEDLRRRLEATSRELDELRAQLAAAQKKSTGPTINDLIATNNQGLQAVLQGNYELALVKFREAAAANYPSAQSNLGLMYLNGTGVPQDGRQAATLFEQAARQGNVTASENLARIYDFGLGINPDRSRAIAWYQVAERQGSPIAHDAIARLKAN